LQEYLGSWVPDEQGAHKIFVQGAGPSLHNLGCEQAYMGLDSLVGCCRSRVAWVQDGHVQAGC
jgi:hypothetical protein